MTRFSRRFLKAVAFALMAMFLLGGGLAIAQSYDPDQDIPKPTLLEKRLNKLGRGLSNLLFGWTEIPLTYDKGIKEGRPLTYIVGTGTVLGVAKAFMRTGVGVYEIVTFPTSKSEVNYDPIIEPDYLF